MKLSLNWLKSYTDIELPPQKVSEILTDIGLEVEGEEEVESIPGGLAGLVIGLVKECGKHPNAEGQKIVAGNIWKTLSTIL